MTREQQEAIAVLQEFYDYNKTLAPHGESWLQADITINRETQRNLAEALPLAIEAMSRLLTDPETGLVPCGCGGKAQIWPSDRTQFTLVVTDYEVGCTECAMTTGWVRRKQENAMKVWNTAMGYTAPSRPGAIVPDAGEMAPNGEEGVRE